MSHNGEYFNPKEVNDIFVQITEYPHCSGNEGPVEKNVVKKIVDDYNNAHKDRPIEIVHYAPDASEPGQRVIVLRKAGSPGNENKKKMVLQGHMDMVCVPDGNIFPIKLNKFKDPQLGVEMLKGGGMDEKTGTTLGADDGIGIATGLAIITDPDENNQMGPLECLFTVQEETNMGGAEGFNVDWLEGKSIVNLDSETDNTITFGSAGGSCANFEKKPGTETIPKSFVTASVSLSGLTGGHSGIDINKGRANAIKVMTELLRFLRNVKCMEVNLVEFTAGTYTNAIPNAANLTVAFDCKYDYDVFHTRVNQFLSGYFQVYRETDPNFDWSIERGSAHDNMLADYCSDELVDMLAAIPTGPRKMLKVPRDVVETSSNLAIIKLDLNEEPNKITVSASNRSASTDSLADMEAIENAIGKLFGAEVIIDDRYPGWNPNPDSPLLKVAEEVYGKIFDGKFKTEVIHAGLECSYFVQRIKDADCISIGPTILTPHTWNERLEIPAVPVFYKCVADILAKSWGTDYKGYT